MGEALSIMMKRFLEEKDIEKRPNPKDLLRVKPFKWGEGTEKTSEEVDEILYGLKK